MTNKYRTHNCGELSMANINEEVRLAGFIQTIRNLGKMMFIDLRDEYGITQIVVSEGIDTKEFTKESTITVSGTVVERASKNPKNSNR